MTGLCKLRCSQDSEDLAHKFQVDIRVHILLQVRDALPWGKKWAVCKQTKWGAGFGSKRCVLWNWHERKTHTLLILCSIYKMRLMQHEANALTLTQVRSFLFISTSHSFMSNHSVLHTLCCSWNLWYSLSLAWVTCQIGSRRRHFQSINEQYRRR